MKKNKILENLKNKKIAILGLGIENQALIKFFINEKVNCAITICDTRDKKVLGEKYKRFNKEKCVSWKLGENANKNLDGFDVLFRSPGWPMDCPGIKEALKMGVELSSPIKLFFDICPTKNIIGVTGTKGKGTTSSLIYNILKESRKRVWLGGNIGIAPFGFINKIRKNDWIILELSSFQLEDADKSLKIAVITNFSGEHLAPADPNNPNYHKSLKEYWQAKLNILKHQKSDGKAVVSKKLKEKLRNHNLKSKVIYFEKSEIESRLSGEHNKENIAAAFEVAKLVGVKEEVIKRAVKKFKGLEHRLEFVRRVKGVDYYEDSFATIPESAITAMKSFDLPIILIAGGAEKNSNFNNFSKVAKRKTKLVILIKGDASPRIKKNLLKIKYSAKNIKSANSMSEAVRLARKNAEKGDVVLLSPACASFGIFKNYKERGDLFKKEARKIK